MHGLRDSALDYFPSQWPHATSAAA
jgi:hypothetical protein